MPDIPEIFNQNGASFVLLRKGQKYPPIEREWQNRPHSFQDATEHAARGGNVGILVGNGYIGLDQDDPAAFEGLELPETTLWETRPGRYGMWLKASDNVAEALAAICKKADQAQLKLFRAGKPCGEVKLQRTYQVIPPSWKTLENGTRADYKLLQEIPPAEISLAKLLADLQAIGITFSSKLEANAAKLEGMARESRKKRAESDEQRARHYAEAALRDEALAVADSPTGSRNEQLNRSAFALGQFVAAGVLSESEVIRELSRAAMNAGLEPEEIRATIASGLESGSRHPREIPEGNEMKADRQIFQRVDCEELTEGGNAARLERIHGEDLRYNHTHKKWYLWNKGRWKIDANGGAMRLAADVVGSLYLAASKADGKDARNELVSFAKATDSRKGLSNMLALAANRLKFALTADDFDRDAWLLGAENATIDLKTGSLREPQRGDLITKAIGARYDEAAQCPLWLKFLDRIFPDEELRKYIKRAVGYCLTSSMGEQAFFFCYGQGANGKSVFLAVLRALLGEYARQADFSTFLVQRNEKVRNDLAALAGARVITAIEAEEGGRLSMQVIKSWTGGDPVTARFLFGENFTFQPQGKLWLAANNKPAITERNHAAWRRVRLIPFTATIPEAERVNEYEKVLYPELPGILNWALEGLQDYQKNGMETPNVVLDATNEYRRENDSLEQFVFECCEMGKLKVCKNTELYDTYLSFCGMSGIKALSQHKFSPELKTREGISHTKNKYGAVWTGIALKSEWVTVCNEPSPIARDAKGDGLSQNAQSFENSSLRENFAQKPSYPSPDSDGKPSPSQKEAPLWMEGGEEGDGREASKQNKNSNPNRHKDGSPQKPNDPGFAEFKAGMAKRHCALCGEDFSYDLGIHWQGGYICARCHREGPPPDPENPNTQQRLSGEDTGT